MYVTFKIALNNQVNASYKPSLYFFCMLAQVYVLLLIRFTYFKYSFNKCIELELLFV